MSLTAIILAAGKSTRMKSRRAKPLHEVCGRSMLTYVLRACYEAGCTRILLVVGHGKDEVIGHVGSDSRITFVEQVDQLGTGHAVKVCDSHLRQIHGDVFILCGDGPLVTSEVLKTLQQTQHEERAVATMGTAVIPNPTGYGRVVRDSAGKFLEIVEQIDCTPEQREIREVFPSLYCVKADELVWAVSQLTNNNKKKEYYLTDIFAHLRRAGKKVAAVQAVAPENMLTINSRQEQAEVEAVMQERIQRQHRNAGVTIVSPASTWIEDGATIGPDTVVYPFTFIGRGSTIGPDCVIGPFAAVPRNSIVPERTNIAGKMSIDAASLQAAS